MKSKHAACRSITYRLNEFLNLTWGGLGGAEDAVSALVTFVIVDEKSLKEEHREDKTPDRDTTLFVESAAISI